MSYFIKFNNISSEGLFKIKKSPSKVLAIQRVENYNIPTLDGEYYKEYGAYEGYDLELECMMIGNYNIENIQKVKEMFLTSEGKLEFSEDEDVYYKARITNIISFNEISQITGEFLLSFRVFPKAYLKQGQEEIEVSHGSIINNIGNTPSEPLIILEGLTGELNIKVVNGENEQNMKFIELLGDRVNVDCHLENCYGISKENYNNKLTLESDFIKLGVGENQIILEPSGAKIKIVPQWVRL